MLLRPGSREELRHALASASAARKHVEKVDLRALNAILEHRPEDMTATVQAGALLSTFQEALRARGQWLPLDPPFPERTTVGDLLSKNLSGPRRQGFGVARDYVIGLQVALADGAVIKAGGKVVKNVAGYDLCKLFIGARDSLGIIVEVTFKLRPVPEAEVMLEAKLETLEEARSLQAALERAGCEPVVLDLHNLNATGFVLVAGFAGAKEEVEQQVERTQKIGFHPGGELAYQRVFWAPELPPMKAAVLPSRTVEILARIVPGQFVARLGAGVIYHRDSDFRPVNSLPLELMQRVKATYDPNLVLPEYQP